MSTDYEKEPIPADLRWEIWKRDDFRCHYCGTRQFLSLDHKIPESKGGSMAPGNLVTACTRCNSQKGTMSCESFVLWREIAEAREHLNAATSVVCALGKLLRNMDTLGISDELCEPITDNGTWRDVVRSIKEVVAFGVTERILGVSVPLVDDDCVTYGAMLAKLKNRIDAA